MDLLEGMAVAIEAGRAAAERGEVPIGAALFRGSERLIVAGNTCHADQDPLQHAEMSVLRQAAQAGIGQTAFRQAPLYVTLEPCPMCMGAILHSHLGQLVFGAYNLKWGSCGTVSDFSSLFPTEALTIWGGIRESECADLLASFFNRLR